MATYFGFEKDEWNIPIRIPHIGWVEISDYVEIGSFTTICRGTLGATKIMNNANADFICTQEGRKPQLMDAESLLKDYSHAFKERSWIEERMYPCIFISKSWNVLGSGDRWLSETPEVPGSKSFESMFPRLMTYAKVQNKEGGKLLIINWFSSGSNEHVE